MAQKKKVMSHTSLFHTIQKGREKNVSRKNDVCKRMEDKKKTSTNGQSSLGGNERRVVNELLYTIKCVNFV